MSPLLTVDRELARGLVGFARDGASGIAHCTRGKLKRLFCVEQGRLCLAASNVIEEQFTEYLVRSGTLGRETLDGAASDTGAQREAKLSRRLMDQGLVAPEIMQVARARHTSALLFDTLDWSDGNCVFERGQPDVSEELTAELEIPPILFEYARERPPSLDLVRMRIGPPNLCPALAEPAERLLELLMPDKTVRRLLGFCNGSRPVGELIDAAQSAPEETWRTLYGLVLAGILEPDPAHARAEIPKDRVTRDEVLARLERAEGADHYTILEQMPTARTEELRSAYYFLARRYHPDRFRTGPLADLLPRMETYFTQVTEAYNTLFDPVLRRSYDEQRGEVARPKRAEQNTRELARQNYVHARSLIEKGRYTDAVTSLENALKLDASVADYHLELGRLLTRNPRRRDEARAHLEGASRLDPALVDAYIALADLELRYGRRSEAVELFREALRWEPGHLEATRRLEELGEAAGSGGGRRGLFGG